MKRKQAWKNVKKYIKTNITLKRTWGKKWIGKIMSYTTPNKQHYQINMNRIKWCNKFYMHCILELCDTPRTKTLRNSSVRWRAHRNIGLRRAKIISLSHKKSAKAND